MTNIDSSSTAHLTMNAAGSNGGGSKPSSGCRSNRGSNNNSDSDLERSPSVTVLKPTGKYINLHSIQEIRQDDKILQNFKLLIYRNKIQAGSFIKHHHHHNHHHHGHGKHAMNPFNINWSRRSTLEKTLIFFSILTTICILLLISSLNLLIAHRGEIELVRKNDGIFLVDRHDKFDAEKGDFIWPICKVEKSVDKARNYCITPDCVKVAASVIEAIDTKIDPCDDFYVSNLMQTNTMLILLLVTNRKRLRAMFKCRMC